MKLIKPYYEIIEPTGYTIEDVYKSIELAGKVSHKSEYTIKEGSAKEFVNRIINWGHNSCLEFGTVYLTIPWNTEEGCLYCGRYDENPYSKIVDDPSNKCTYVTTNYRVILENKWEESLKWICTPQENHIKRYCVKFVCSRSISHEFVRHRKFSFMQESQRYVGSSSIKPIIEYDCNNFVDICSAYQQGFSMKSIADNSSLSEWNIRKILLANNIPIRGLNNKGNRIEDYFSVIDTPEKAYLLGMIQTDGSVHITHRNALLSITQHKDYAWYIEDMLLDFSDKVCNTKDRNCRQLQIGSKSIVNDLINMGIVPNKTNKQTDEDINKLWESVPIEFKGDFIRGCIDGDGHVTFYTQQKAINESCSIGFCSVKEILVDKIIEFINTKFNYKCGKNKNGNVYRLYITDRKKAIEIGKYLYSNFKYPFGHPKKSAAWIKRIGEIYPLANYKDYKFQIIYPHWLNSSSPETIYSFISAMDKCEDSYTKLRMLGWKPEQAREVLPNATKTELYMCGFSSDWEDFFRLRDDKQHAHPQAYELAHPIHEEFIKRNYL